MSRKVLVGGLGLGMVVLLGLMVCWVTGPRAETPISKQARRVITENEGPGAESSARRVALVIGNSAYQHEERLQSPGNDAQVMAKSLKLLGFELVQDKPLLDLDRQELEQAIWQFGRMIRGSAVSLFYYSGHGMQSKGVNYLLPVSALINDEDELEIKALEADKVLKAMSAAQSPVNIIILDACRNNKFARKKGGREAGLASMRAAGGNTIIAYATEPGGVADDGPKGGYSPYTAALSEAMVQPGVRLEDIFIQVTQEVKRATAGKQTPWVNLSVEKPIYLSGRPGRQDSGPGAGAGVAENHETLFWKSILGSKNPEDFQEYLRQCEKGVFGGIFKGLAQNKIKELTAAGPAAAAAAPKAEPVFRARVQSGGKWGYIDQTGKLVVELKFKDARGFEEGLAAVQRGDKWGFIDKTGGWIVEPMFGNVWDFSEGLASVLRGSRIGYVDKTGKLAMEFRFEGEAGGYFYEGLAAVKSDGKWGFIDQTGRWVVQPRFEGVWPFSEGLAPAKSGGKWGFVDKTGKLVVEPRFEKVHYFKESLAPVKSGGKWGYLDKTGKLVVEPRFKEVSYFYEGLASVKIGGKCGLIDKTGNMVVEPRFEELWAFSEGLAAVKHGGKWGFIEKTGQMIVEPKFEELLGFSEGLVPAKRGGKWGFIDKTGKWVVEPRFEAAKNFNEGLAAVKSGGKWGYIDKSGRWVITPRLDSANSFSRVE